MNRNRNKIYLLGFLTLYLSLISIKVFALPASPTISDFNNPPSLDGWSCVAGSCTNPGSGGASSGGIGDGYLRYVDFGGSIQGDVLASSAFLDDYSSASSMTLEFDMKIFNIGGSLTRELGINFFSGSSTNFSGIEFANFNSGIFVDSPTGWIHVVVPLDFTSTGWDVRSGFDSSSITFVRFAGDWNNGVEIIGYDNVSINSASAPVFVPDIEITDSVVPNNDERVPFGDVTVGNNPEQTVTVTNNGNANLNIGTIAGFAVPFSIPTDNCSGQTLLPAANCKLTLQFAPTSVGLSSGSFNIPSNDPDADENPVTVHVSGMGLSSATNNPPTAPELVFPVNGETVSGPDVTFGFNRSTDPDGDTIKYTLSVCEDADLTIGCITNNVVAAVKNKAVDYAGLSLGLGFGLIFGGVLLGRFGNRKKIGLMMAVLVVSGLLLVSCGGDDDNGGGKNRPTDITHTVTGLKGGTTYQWQVVADDGNGGTAKSEKRNFSTQ